MYINLSKSQYIISIVQSMQNYIIPPQNDIQHILDQLKLKSIEDLYLLQNLNIDSIAKSTNNHKLKVLDLLTEIQKIITKTPTNQLTNTIWLSPIIDRWRDEDNGVLQSQIDDKIDYSLNEFDVVQVLGRVNGGKSYLMNEMIMQCFKQNKKVIYLDSNRNIEKLLYRMHEESLKNSEFNISNIYFKHLEFRSISELSIILHSLGNHLIHQKDSPFYIFIDSITRSQEPQPQNSQPQASIQSKTVDKLKKLIIQISQKIGTIIYASRSNNHNVLFNNSYKNSKYRPKLMGNSQKLWDSIADKTFCVDFSRTKDDRQHWRIISTKSINCKLYQFTRKLN